MPFSIRRSATADAQIKELESTDSKKHKKVLKTIGKLSQDPRHPGLNTHKYDGLTGPGGRDVFEAYVENNTPAAYRVFWCYGPLPKQITIIAVTPHP